MKKTAFIFLVIFLSIQISCKKQNYQPEEIEDYAIYNQILYQIGDYGIYIYGDA
jgi:hypothetical protein